MIVILAKMKFKSVADRDRMLKETASVGEATRREPGAIEYRSTIDPEDGLVMHTIEIFESEEAVLSHHRSPHMTALYAKVADIRTEVSARAFEGNLKSYDLSRLVQHDSFTNDSGTSMISVTLQ